MKVYESPKYNSLTPELFPWKKCESPVAQVVGECISHELKTMKDGPCKNVLRGALAYLAGAANL
jgi:hypothetical protein